MTEPDKVQQRIREFMQLLPVTVELAGLPDSEHGRYYSPEQIEARTITFKHAYRAAKQMVLELANQ